MSPSARLIATAIASAVVTAVVAGVLMNTQPASAQVAKTAVCRQMTAGIALDPNQVTQVMNGLLAQGKTSIVMIGSTACAY